MLCESSATCATMTPRVGDQGKEKMRGGSDFFAQSLAYVKKL